jgi:hypothetical protein
MPGRLGRAVAVIENSTAYDVAYAAALNGRPYNEFSPRSDYARGFARGALERAQEGGRVPHTEHRPAYTLKHDERVRVKFRASGDVAVAIVDRDGIETMTLDLEFGQALELRDGINRAQAQRHDSIPIYPATA